MDINRVEVLGIPVDCVNMSQSIDVVDQLISGECATSIIAVNPEKVIKAQTDSRLLNCLNEAGLLIPDGIGLVVAVKILGLGNLSRVPGAELMPAICERAAEKGYSIFLFGAEPDVNLKAREVLQVKYPDLQIAGGQDGYVSEKNMPQLINDINESGAQILFIALGSPRQELWMEEYLPQLQVKVCQGVGGTFDVISGKVKRAPSVFRSLHLEWFYRLASQPRRLLRQTALPRFVVMIIRKRIGLL